MSGHPAVRIRCRALRGGVHPHLDLCSSGILLIEPGDRTSRASPSPPPSAPPSPRTSRKDPSKYIRAHPTPDSARRRQLGYPVRKQIDPLTAPGEARSFQVQTVTLEPYGMPAIRVALLQRTH